MQPRGSYPIRCSAAHCSQRGAQMAKDAQSEIIRRKLEEQTKEMKEAHEVSYPVFFSVASVLPLSFPPPVRPSKTDVVVHAAQLLMHSANAVYDSCARPSFVRTPIPFLLLLLGYMLCSREQFLKWRRLTILKSGRR
eukprot:GHVU01124041.1.p1 GENE.GHVU01124041.1~~GHVU01124041.1.p1  ORF type:complete len:137 (-),score=5.79 GHVU01124041.1:2101-2511(-)